MKTTGNKMENNEVKPLQYLCRHYIDVQQVRIGLEHRIRSANDEYVMRKLGEGLGMTVEQLEDKKLIKKIPRTEKHTITEKGKKTFEELLEKGKITKDANVEELFTMLHEYRKRAKKEENTIVSEAQRLLGGTALFEWCDHVRGLATISAMEFMGYINVGVPTSGHAKAYLGLIPSAAMKSGSKTNINWEGKGKAYLFARNVIMQKDPYYTALYKAKKDYYAHYSKYAPALKDPRKCPNYETCKEKLEKAAKRMNREVKKFPCKMHIDGLAKRWLAALIISHMWEIGRIEKGGKYVPYGKNATGWDIPIHKMHIPPKPKDEKEQKEILEIAVPLLKVGVVPTVNLADADERKGMLKYIETLKEKK